MNTLNFEDVDLNTPRNYVENYHKLTVNRDKQLFECDTVKIEVKNTFGGKLLPEMLSSEYIQWVDNKPYQKCTGKTLTYGKNSGNLCINHKHTHNEFSDPLSFRLLNELYIKQGANTFKYRDNKKTTRIAMAKLSKKIEGLKSPVVELKIVPREFNSIKYLAIEIELL